MTHVALLALDLLLEQVIGALQQSDVLAATGHASSWTTSLCAQVIVDYSATWCGPCKMIGPIYEQLGQQPQYAGVTFLKVDVDELKVCYSLTDR